MAQVHGNIFQNCGMSLNSKLKVRNEAQIKFWMDKWLGSVALESDFSLL